ncbi:hypothetical protein Rcae01_05090 [Novipirellula caenicola]|uniref:Secreted protein n=1 Tax=Novipirellula caenicola TaxID=1536901 RepID=A0ABP9VYC9_9BACT
MTAKRGLFIQFSLVACFRRSKSSQVSGRSTPPHSQRCEAIGGVKFIASLRSPERGGMPERGWLLFDANHEPI